MVRTQVYLTEHEHQSLRHLTGITGKSQSELIRKAIDLFLDMKSITPKQGLKMAAGMWADRKDLPDFSSIRQEFDRFTDDEK